MKKLLYIILPLIALAFCSCEEEESELIFSTENITNPENVKIEYFSPDPSCQPKEYVITTNNCESEITLKCKNANQIYLGIKSSSTDENDAETSSSNEYNSLSEKWQVRIIDSNTLIFTFDKINLEDTEDFIYSGVQILAKDKKGQISSFIKILRLVKSSGPVN